MPPLGQRLLADSLALESFAELNSPHVTIAHRAPDHRRFAVDAKFDAPVVSGEGYRIAPEHRLLVEIPDNYLARDARGMCVKSRIRRDGERVFHPNVWPNEGFFCYDDRFHPSKSLAEQVYTAMRLMTGRLINHDSPADWRADYVWLHQEDQILAQISPVELRLPRGLPRAGAVSLPKVA